MRNGSKYCGDLGRASTEGWPGAPGPGEPNSTNVTTWQSGTVLCCARALWPAFRGKEA